MRRRSAFKRSPEHAARAERLGLSGADVQADDLTLALGVDRDSNHRCNTHDPAALADLEIGDVEPEIGAPPAAA